MIKYQVNDSKPHKCGFNTSDYRIIKDTHASMLNTSISIRVQSALPLDSQNSLIIKGFFLSCHKKNRISNYIHNPDVDYIMAQLKREEFLLIEQIIPLKRLFKVKKCLVDYIEDYYE